MYSTANLRPQITTVHVRSASIDPQSTRYPCVEGVMDGALIQNYVHDFFLRVVIKRRSTLFRVFVKRHKNLPFNPFLGIQGDVLVMRVASRNRDSLVNLRASDMRILDRLLTRYAPLPFIFSDVE